MVREALFSRHLGQPEPLRESAFPVLRPVFRGDDRMAIVNLTEARIRDLALGSGIHRDQQVTCSSVAVAAAASRIAKRC